MTTIRVFGDPALDGPSGVIAAAGDVWFTSIGNHRVGRVRDGRIETFADPADRVRLPANIFPGGDGRVWFTSLGSDALGAIDPASPDPASTIVTYALPAGSRPVALKSAPDGRLWFSLRGADALGSVDPGADDPAGSLRTVYSPTISGPAALFVTPDGRVWWVNSSTDTVGCLDTASGAVGVVEPPLGSPRAWTQTADGRLWLSTREPAGLWSFDPADPSGSARHVTHERLREPDGVWAGVDGAVWIADTAANTLAGYHPVTGRWHFAGGPPQVGGPFDIKAGPDDGNLWFTNKAGNTIGCLTLSGGPAQE